MHARGRENLSNNFFITMTDRWKLIKMKDAARRMMIMLGWITVQQTLKQTNSRQSMNLIVMSSVACKESMKAHRNPLMSSTPTLCWDVFLFLQIHTTQINRFFRDTVDTRQKCDRLQLKFSRNPTTNFSVFCRELSNSLLRLLESF